MNPFDRLLSKIHQRALRVSGGTKADDEKVDAFFKRGSNGGSGPMYIATVNRCINLIAGSIASMPLRYQAKNAKGTFRDVESAPLYRLLRFQPNDRTSAFEFWRTAIRRMLLDGVAYIVPVRADGKLDRLCLLFQSKGTPDGAKSGHVCYNCNTKVYTVDDREQGLNHVRLSESEIIVLRAQSPDSVESDAVVKFAAGAIERAAAGNEESLTRITNGGQGRMLLHEEDTISGTGTAIEGARRRLSDKVAEGLRRDRLVTLVPRGLKATPSGSSSVDMQLQGMREYDVREICRFFGVPPQYVFSDSTSNYKSAEMAAVDFMTNALDPILRMIESELLRKLVPADMWTRERVEFDRTARMAMDSDSRAKYFTQMLSIGAMTPNDIRRLLDREPVEDGDTVLVSANLRPINDITNNTQNEEAKKDNPL